LELKKPTVNVYDAYNDNLRDYKDTIPQLFWYNCMTILSNGTQSKVGAFNSPWTYFKDWKRIENEEEK
jgi:type I restriction enzyme R subunit